MTTIRPTDRILLHGVDVDLSEDELRKELVANYRGIKSIERLCKDDQYKTPREVVQIQFTSVKYTEDILKNGYVNIGLLRCSVRGVKPSISALRQIKDNNGLDVSEDTEQPSNKILVHGVPTNIPVNELGEELSKIYDGIKFAKRWYENAESQVPTDRVQIDFKSSKDTESILRNGYIQIGKFYWSVTAYKPHNRQRNYIEYDDSQSDNHSDYQSDYQSDILTEQQILQTFEKQKQQLSELINRFDARLNNAIGSQTKNRDYSLPA
ncbi:hypothetical protein I4U23_003871 [Adineta vaga]|nr:hypothetical protein I4U23_003871 [Adineta vaga]